MTEESRLRGSLVREKEKRLEIQIGNVVVNKDFGKCKVDRIVPRVVLITADERKLKITKGYDELLSRLNDKEDGVWQWV